MLNKFYNVLYGFVRRLNHHYGLAKQASNTLKHIGPQSKMVLFMLRPAVYHGQFWSRVMFHIFSHLNQDSIDIKHGALCTVSTFFLAISYLILLEVLTETRTYHRLSM